MVQSQERTLLQHHIPEVPQPIVHPTPTSITQPIGPRIEHRSIPPYPNPFLRPPPRLILFDSLLFKLVTNPERETVLLAVPEICADKIIMLYHTSLFAGHPGVIKTYLTINDKFFIPGLMH